MYTGIGCICWTGARCLCLCLSALFCFFRSPNSAYVYCHWLHLLDRGQVSAAGLYFWLLVGTFEGFLVLGGTFKYFCVLFATWVYWLHLLDRGQVSAAGFTRHLSTTLGLADHWSTTLAAQHFHPSSPKPTRTLSFCSILLPSLAHFSSRVSNG